MQVQSTFHCRRSAGLQVRGSVCKVSSNNEYRKGHCSSLSIFHICWAHGGVPLFAFGLPARLQGAHRQPKAQA